MKIIGHRGALGLAPENTILSIQKALDLSVDMIEFDVQKIRTNELVAFHDRSTFRLTGKPHILANLTSFELNNLRVSQTHHIPYLGDILDLVDGKTPLNIEIKSDGAASILGNMLRVYISLGKWKTTDFIISSFNHQELVKFKNDFPEFNIGVLLYHFPHNLAQIGSDLNAYSLHCSIDFISPTLINDAKKRGMKVFVYTVNSQDDYNLCDKWGVDGIFTDYPNKFLKPKQNTFIKNNTP